jgi:hypothetical protein
MSDILTHDNGLPMVQDSTGEYRVLAALPPSGTSALPSFEEKYGILPESEWVEGDIAPWIDPPIYDQGRTSECVGCASAVAFFKAWAEAGGAPPPAPFSAGWIYSFINGGKDAGAMVHDGGQALIDHGVCTQIEGPEGDLFPKQFPPQAVIVAALYKVLGITRINSVAGLGTALTMKKIPVVGILVGKGFMQQPPDEEGIMAVDPLNAIIGGHALPLTGMHKSKKYNWKFPFPNSWKIRWGIQGWGNLQPGHFAAQIDAYCIDSIVQV